MREKIAAQVGAVNGMLARSELTLCVCFCVLSAGWLDVIRTRRRPLRMIRQRVSALVFLTNGFTARSDSGWRYARAVHANDMYRTNRLAGGIRSILLLIQAKHEHVL